MNKVWIVWTMDGDLMSIWDTEAKAKQYIIDQTEEFDDPCDYDDPYCPYWIADYKMNSEG